MVSQSVQLLAPVLFIVIYGSGFVGTKLGLPYAEPFTFLTLRFLLATFLLGVIAFFLKAKRTFIWRINDVFWLVVSGLLLQGVLSAGTFYAIYCGIKPAVAALIIALQPLLVAVLGGFYLGEKVSMQRWIGLFIGIFGVAVVVGDGLSRDGMTLVGLGWSVLGLLGLTLGQLVQKKHCASMDLFAGGSLQSFSAAIAMVVFAFCFESMHVDWSVEFYMALSWMGVGVSVGALSLLYLMLRQSTANQVASLFYGIPVSAALIAWPLFGQIPTLIDCLGFILVALSIVVANSHFQPIIHKAKRLEWD